MKTEISLLDMLKAGVHFGHRKSKWHPKMGPYVYGIRHNVHIIDLESSLKRLLEAKKFVKKIVEKNGTILFIGTKKQVKQLVKDSAREVNMPYVNERWLGGTFTNFKVISNLLEHYRELLELKESDRFKELSKRDKHKTEQELLRLENKVGGVRDMRELPQAVFLADPKENSLAAKEARELGIPTVAIVDTNTDPTSVDYPIPANDDAIKSVKLIISEIINSINEGRSKSKIAKKS